MIIDIVNLTVNRKYDYDDKEINNKREIHNRLKSKWHILPTQKPIES